MKRGGRKRNMAGCGSSVRTEAESDGVNSDGLSLMGVMSIWGTRPEFISLVGRETSVSERIWKGDGGR